MSVYYCWSGGERTRRWNSRFVELAKMVATWSKDPSAKVGAVIVDPDRRIVATGYNGFPRGVHDHEERYSVKEMKYRLVVHAEANAILNAIQRPVGMGMVTTKFPCSDCSKLIAQSGLGSVLTPHPAKEGVWADDAEFSRLILDEAGVTVVYYGDP